MRNKTGANHKRKKRSPIAFSPIESILKLIEKDILPSEILPTGDLWFHNPDVELLHSERFVFQEHHFFHLFSLVARNFSLAEIQTEFAMIYLDWDRMKEIGSRQAADSLMELRKKKNKLEQYKANISAGDPKTKMLNLQRQVDAHVLVPASAYAAEMVKWLNNKVRNALYRNRENWSEWIAEEHHRWIIRKSESIPIYSKEYRMAVYDRLLNYELSQPSKDSNKIVKIMEAARYEDEGTVTTVQWNVQDVSDSIMAGTMTKEDWLEVIGTIQRMLIAAAKGEPVEDIRRLIAESWGEMAIEAECYLESKDASQEE